jgi:hypothetical protein
VSLLVVVLLAVFVCVGLVEWVEELLNVPEIVPVLEMEAVLETVCETVFVEE